MVLGNITNINAIETLINQVSSLTTIFQAIGGLIIAYIIFNIINIIWSRKKNQEIKRIRELLEEINRRLSKKKS